VLVACPNPPVRDKILYMLATRAHVSYNKMTFAHLCINYRVSYPCAACVCACGGGVRYVAKVRVVDENGKASKLQLDQDDLETVVPKPGGLVRVVNGRGRGCTAQLLDIDTANFVVAVEVVDGDGALPKGERLEKVEYEDICKLNAEGSS